MRDLLLVLAALCNTATGQLPLCCPDGYTAMTILDDVKYEFFYMANNTDCISSSINSESSLFHLKLTCGSGDSFVDVLTLQKTDAEYGQVQNLTVFLDFDDVCFDDENMKFGYCRLPEGNSWKTHLMEYVDESITLFLNATFQRTPDFTDTLEFTIIRIFVVWGVFVCTRASILLLLITSIIYCSNKTLRNNPHSAYVVSHSVCLAMANACDFNDLSNYWLWRVQLNGYISLFFNLATYFWLNAMILEIHFTLRSMHHATVEKTTKKLKCLALFIWAIPLLMTTTAIWAKHLGDGNIINFTFPLQFQKSFVNYMIEYLPMLLIIAVNSGLFLQTFITILPTKSSSTQNWNVQLSKNDGMAYDKKFIFLALYAWGTPLILTIIALSNKYRELGFKPNLLESLFSWKILFCVASTCYLDAPQYWIYFVGPVSTIVFINLTIFLVTTIGLYRHKKKTSVIISREDSKAQDKTYFFIYIKLFVVSGVCWGMGSSLINAFNYASMYDDDSDDMKVAYRWFLIYIPMTLIVSLQGLFVFALFVCNERTIGLVRQDACSIWNYLTCNKQTTAPEETYGH